MSLKEAFDATVAATDLIKAADAALVDAGRVIADQIDNAVANLTGSDVTKALYLMPHLVNILKEMLATPAARAAAGLGDKETAGGKLASLQAARSKRSA
jgi:hypothetical protein